MNTKIYVIGTVIVAVMLVILAWGTGVIGANPYWETETDFGMWGEEIIIEYEDGTTDSLRLLQTVPISLGTLTYGGKAINTVYYRLKAKATGTGYTEAVIKFTNYDIDIKIYKDTSVKWSDVVHKGTSINGIPLDGQWHLISAKGGANFDDIFEAHDWASGTYKLKFTPATSTDPIYWGTPGQSESDGVSVNLPSGKYMTVEWDVGGTLTVVLGAEFEY